MSHLEHMMEQLKRDNHVPENVRERLDHTLKTLPKSGVSARPKKKWKRRTAAAACILMAGAVICWANPALAAKIPLIGGIFAEVEQQIPFSGDYSQKAETLSTEIRGEETNNREKGERANTQANAGISVTDAGIKATASEIYCDGLSIFLTLQLQVKEGGLTNIPGHYINDAGDTADAMYLRGEWKLDGMNEPQMLMNNFLEGKVADDHTFVGMVKLDLNNYDLDRGTLVLSLSAIGWDDVTMLNQQEDLSESHRVEGQWEFEIPFTVDTESAKEITVGQGENGYTIDKIFISPYQVVSYVTLADSNMEYHTLICNQDGELLDVSNPTDGVYGKDVFAVNGKTISSVTVYVFDDFEEWLEVGKSRFEDENGRIDMQLAGDRAEVFAQVKMG